MDYSAPQQYITPGRHRQPTGGATGVSRPARPGQPQDHPGDDQRLKHRAAIMQPLIGILTGDPQFCTAMWISTFRVTLGISSFFR